MKITDRGTYTILADDRNFIQNSSSFGATNENAFYEQNVVVDLFHANISLDELLDILVFLTRTVPVKIVYHCE